MGDLAGCGISHGLRVPHRRLTQSVQFLRSERIAYHARVRREVSVAASALGSLAASVRSLRAAAGDVPPTWIDVALPVSVVLCAVYALAPRQLRFWERWEHPFDTTIADATRCVIAATPDHAWPSYASADTHVFVKVLHRAMCEGDLSVAGSSSDFEGIRPISKTRCRSLTPAVGLVPGGRVTHLLRSEEIRNYRPSEVYRNLHVRSVDLYRLWPHAKQPAPPVLPGIGRQQVTNSG